MTSKRLQIVWFAWLLVTALAAFPGALCVIANDQPAKERRVLVVTGEDYAGHNWRQTAPALIGELAKDDRLRIDMLSDLKSLNIIQLKAYDAVVLHFKNYDANTPGREAYDNLAQFVEQGGGLMLVHFACGAFEEFKKDFEQLAGRAWFGIEPPPGRAHHDPHGEFTVQITGDDHPITKGLKDFQTTDELYTCLEGDAPIETLATAVSKLDGKTYPMAFVLTFGKGRVFHSVLGHDPPAFLAAGPAELHRRGCAWVAGLAPVTTD
jgi:type 1 glutamine amidotransferase